MSMKDEEKVNKLRDKISRIKRDGLEEYEVRPCYRSSDIGHLGCVVRVEEQEREKKKQRHCLEPGLRCLMATVVEPLLM